MSTDIKRMEPVFYCQDPLSGRAVGFRRVIDVVPRPVFFDCHRVFGRYCLFAERTYDCLIDLIEE